MISSERKQMNGMIKRNPWIASYESDKKCITPIVVNRKAAPIRKDNFFIRVVKKCINLGMKFKFHSKASI